MNPASVAEYPLPKRCVPAYRAGKKTYTVLMGKPAPAKLANFPEVEVWVQVAEPQVRRSGLRVEVLGYVSTYARPRLNSRFKLQ